MLPPGGATCPARRLSAAVASPRRPSEGDGFVPTGSGLIVRNNTMDNRTISSMILSNYEQYTGR